MTYSTLSVGFVGMFGSVGSKVCDGVPDLVYVIVSTVRLAVGQRLSVITVVMWSNSDEM